MLFGIGAVITAGTCLFMPQIRIVFGILTFIGTATLLMIPLDKITGRLRLKYQWLYKASLIISAVLFLFSYNINKGYADFKEITILSQNDEYAIVKPNSTYGLRVYDYIALKADTVSDDQFINE